MPNALLDNAVILLALCIPFALFWREWADRPESDSLPMRFVIGVCFGVACIAGMMRPVMIQPGLFFDARAVVLGMAGLFGGPIVAAVAALTAAAYRIWIGGIGLWVGLINIALPTLLALAYRRQHQKARWAISAWPLLAFGLLVSLTTLATQLLLPRELIAHSLRHTALPILLVIPAATVAMGMLLHEMLQRGQTTRALRLSEARLRAITEATPEPLMVIDEDGRCREVITPRQSRFPDLSNLVGRRLHDLLPASQAARFDKLLAETLASDCTMVVEHSLDTPAGKRIFEGHACRIETPIGGRRAVTVLLREITERVHNELEKRIAAIAFESQQGMLITDASNHILKVNQAFTQITGYSADEVIGKTTRVLRSGRHSSEFYKQMWRSILEQDSWEGEIWNRRKNGDIYPEWLTISAVRDSTGSITHFVAALTDITERKAAETQIHHLAFYDPLTDLPNRRLLLDRLQQALLSASRSGQYGALMIFDLDNFKNINDLHGHQVGDKLLCEVSARLNEQVRSCDTVARLGGDEFVMVLEGFKAEPDQAATQVEYFGERILASLAKPYRLGDLTVRSTASIGVVLFNDVSLDVDELMKRADMSMYEAKLAGRNSLRFFDPYMQQIVSARLRLEEELRRGLEAREFVIYFQPQVDTARGIVGAEALVRWRHPERGVLAPGDFIEGAERGGLVQYLDLQVLELACKQLARWASQPSTERLALAVNISAPLLYQGNFVERVLELVRSNGFNPKRLKLELTESLLLDDMPEASLRMSALKAHGIHFSIDDFGTGYSSMTYLHRLPLDQLKIDRSFIQGMASDNGLAIVRAICALASTLDLEVLAEGVETQPQRQMLENNGCHLFQGYLFGQPVPIEAFEEMVARAARQPVSTCLGEPAEPC
ncbi:EAL domain-containing protein [Stutzerimonas tarimensis]|uniref:EAL domain-containing protein n=1 Tax=Stutzerimonas tarimensis TaxID=1507735 RepID=A0ABV7T9Z4_9GAMM